MYLPPKINSIASSGFGRGGQASIMDFAGGGNNDGYGGATVPNAYTKGNNSPSSAERSGYDLTTLNGVQTTAGSYGTTGFGVGSSSDQNNGNTILESVGGNNGGLTLLGDKTSSTPDNYGQNELLSSTTTAQSSPGLGKNNFIEDAEASRYGQNLQYGGRAGIVQNAASAGGYGSSASTSFQNDAGDKNPYGPGDNGNFGSSTGGGQRFSSGNNGGYGNTLAPRSFDQTKPGNGDYSQNVRTTNTPNAQFGTEKNTDNSYNLGAYGPGPAGQTSSVPNFNNPGTPPNNRAGSRGQQQISSVSQYNGRSFGGAFSSTYGQQRSGGFGNPADSYYNQNSRDFNSFTTGNNNEPRSSLQGSNNNYYGQSGSQSLVGETYGLQRDAAGLSSSMNGLNRGGQLQQLSSDGYGQSLTRSQPLKTEGNFKQSVSNVPTTASDEGYYNQGRQSNGPNNNDFDQSQPGFPQVSNNYGGQIESQIPSSSGRDCSGQSDSVLSSANGGYTPGGGLSNTPNRFGRIDRPATPSSTSDEYSRNNQNSPNSYNTRGGSSSSASYEENDAGTEIVGGPYGPSTSTSAERNGDFDLPATGQRQNSDLSTAGYGQRTTGGTPCGQNGPLLGSPSTGGGTPANYGYGIRDQKKHSTFVPKDRYQNSNSPPIRDSTTNANGNNEPGSNAFSNFAPGNQPNQPSTNTSNNIGASTSYDSTTNNTGDYREPVSNTFSNFAPGNWPNQPPQLTDPSNNNCDYMSNNNHVNNASKLTQAIFSSSSTGY